MAISSAPIQTKENTAWTSGTTITVTLDSTPSDGNFLALCYAANGNANTIASISQTGASWSIATGQSASGRDAEVWYAPNVSSASTTITVTFNSTIGAAAQVNCVVTEWSGVATSSPNDAGTANNGNSNLPATGSVTPTASRNVLMLSAIRISSLAAPMTSGPDNSFTALTSSNTACAYAYRVVASASGGYAVGYQSTNSNTWDASIASFTDPGGGGGTPIQGRTVKRDQYFDDADSFSWPNAVIMTGGSPGIIPATYPSRTYPAFENLFAARELQDQILLFPKFYGARVQRPSQGGAGPAPPVGLALQRPGDSASS